MDSIGPAVGVSYPFYAYELGCSGDWFRDVEFPANIR